MRKKEKTTQTRDNKVVQGRNGLRSYQFEEVKKGKRNYIYVPNGMSYTEVFSGFFYKKRCLYCGKEFEAKRVDATFCGQACQKANLRIRKKQ